MKRYTIISENNMGILLESTNSKLRKDICFVHHISYEKFSCKKIKYYGFLKLYKYIYISKRMGNKDIVNHSNNLINFLIANNLHNVSLIAVSYGGLIASLASKNKIIKKVILFQTPLWGTPLADYNNWNKLNKTVRKYLSKRYDKNLINVYLDDLANGLKDKWKDIDTNKITFVYGYSIRTKGLVSLYNRLYFWSDIKKISSMDNDAVVPFPNVEILEKIGFNKIIYLKNIYHICTVLKKYHLKLLQEIGVDSNENRKIIYNN